MCNETGLQFVTTHLLEDEVSGKKVLEVGSCNVNGSSRSIISQLKPSSYHGVDVNTGPGVDEICDVNDLIRRFGPESFDLVISTEVLEHVYNWRNAISNLKNILKPNGILILTTRSRGFQYHGYPFDFWRYEESDFSVLFSDLFVEIMEKDIHSPGIFLKAKKPAVFSEKNFSDYEVYSIIRQKRCRDLKPWDIYLFKFFKRPLRGFLSRIIPIRAARQSLRRWT